MRKLALVLFLFLAVRTASGAAFQNGSFELPVGGPGPCFATLPNGSTSITGWTVVSGDGAP